jgi:hypothetical protein
MHQENHLLASLRHFQLLVVAVVVVVGIDTDDVPLR